MMISRANSLVRTSAPCCRTAPYRSFRPSSTPYGRGSLAALTSRHRSDLTGEGFILVGGRLDYVDGHRTGVIVYRRRLHLINVFMWPAGSTGGDTSPELSGRNGYNIVSFRRNGLATWLVSDLNTSELRQLADLL